MLQDDVQPVGAVLQDVVDELHALRVGEAVAVVQSQLFDERALARPRAA